MVATSNCVTIIVFELRATLKNSLWQPIFQSNADPCSGGRVWVDVSAEQ